MKNLIISLLFIFFGCAAYRIDTGRQYYIDRNNYPLVVIYSGWDKNHQDYLHHVKNYSYAIHLKDSFAIGDTLIFKKK